MIVEIKEHPKLRDLLKVTFPKYRKHKAIVKTRNSVTCNCGYWDGGSITCYNLVDIPSRHVQLIHTSSKVSPKVELGIGQCIVETGVFCGRKATMCISFRKEDFQDIIE